MANMTTQVICIPGAGSGSYETFEPHIEALRRSLGPGYAVRYPRMPEPDAPIHAAWAARIADELRAADAAHAPRVIAVGHSLGGTTWLKYLSEAPAPRRLAAICCLGIPFWGAPDWERDDFALRADFAARLPPVPVFLYHCRDDAIAPFDHLALYRQHLPQAVVRAIEHGGHFFSAGLGPLAEDIHRLA
jgi:hypothetical protein